jgi:hypothetical protein
VLYTIVRTLQILKENSYVRASLAAKIQALDISHMKLWSYDFTAIFLLKGKKLRVATELPSFLKG